MDLLTIFGLVLGLTAVAGGQYLDGGDFTALLNGSALIIVMGGTLGAVMLQTPFHIFKRAFKILVWVIKPPQISFASEVEKLIEWSKQVRKHGLLVLENSLEEEKDEFTAKGINIILGGCDPDSVKRILEVDIDTYETRDMSAAKVFESMGGYSPTIGIIGAVLGLIEVMRHLTDPSQLGAGIAVAFVATIYGVGLANLVFLPVAHKLKTQVARKIRQREMIVDGLVSLAEGEHPRVIESRLTGYIEHEVKPTKKKLDNVAKE